MCVCVCVYVLECILMGHIIVSLGIPEYNCFINVNKTVKNFEISEGREAKITTDGGPLYIYIICVHLQCCITIVDSKWLPWCGYLVNTITLEVRVDYSRYSFTGT